MPNSRTKKISHELAFFKRLDAWLLILIIAIGFGGLFAWVSYIAPLLTEVAHFSPSSISYIMMLAGIGMFVGNLCGGYLADKYPPAQTALALLLIMALDLIIVYFTSSNQTLSLIMTFTTGALAFAIGSPTQILMINLAKEAEMLAAAVSQASFNMGNALGAFLGGLPLFYGASYASPNLVGAAMAFTGAMIVIILLVHAKKL
jgi:DHA1 family arabinose polymer transporter-like MFS transporter